MIEEDFEKNKTPQIAVVYLDPREQNLYQDLKKFLTNKMHCPSQFIVRKTLRNPKGAMSAASKICIQMSAKVGAIPWEVHTRHNYFRGRKFMYGGISFSKIRKGYSVSFVGTINNQCSQVFGHGKTGNDSKEAIPSIVFEKMFIEWAKSYFMKEKKVPETIILYHEGMSSPQTLSQLRNTIIPALLSMIKIIGEKTKTKGYKP